MSVRKTILGFMGVMALAAFATVASAQQRPSYGTAITIDAAKKMAAGAVRED